MADRRPALAPNLKLWLARYGRAVLVFDEKLDEESVRQLLARYQPQWQLGALKQLAPGSETNAWGIQITDTHDSLSAEQNFAGLASALATSPYGVSSADGRDGIGLYCTYVSLVGSGGWIQVTSLDTLEPQKHSISKFKLDSDLKSDIIHHAIEKNTSKDTRTNSPTRIGSPVDPLREEWLHDAIAKLPVDEEQFLEDARKIEAKADVMRDTIGKLGQLAVMNRLYKELPSLMQGVVDDVRAMGLTWSEIGEAVGLSERAAYQRWDHRARERNRAKSQARAERARRTPPST